ncbi:MAG TPA: hypothetical protein VGQ57_14345 [Polyangiaceae bacterium]|jgi:hypothetical protein|nr:hypothetical protein [Polyangiaceae bacterium]
MACFTTWTVLPHEPIQKLSENLWCVQGVMPDGKTSRKMSVVRMNDGSLFVHNAIALEEPAMQELEAFGRPSFIVVPGGFHRQDARIWKDRYPSAKVVAPRGAAKKVASVVPVDLSYAEAPSDDAVKLSHFEGCKEREGVVEVKSADGTTLIINDIVCNLPQSGGLLGFFMAPTGQASVPRITRWIVASGKGLGEHLDRLAKTPRLKRLILSHGDNIAADPTGALRNACATA